VRRCARITLEQLHLLVDVPPSSGYARLRRYSHVHMIVIDEAARVPSDLYQAVRPMTAVSKESRIICVSTPNSKQGFFHHCWEREDAWTKIEIPATASRAFRKSFSTKNGERWACRGTVRNTAARSDESDWVGWAAKVWHLTNGTTRGGRQCQA
jgi:hypothetical protein